MELQDSFAGVKSGWKVPERSECVVISQPRAIGPWDSNRERNLSAELTLIEMHEVIATPPPSRLQPEDSKRSDFLNTPPQSVPQSQITEELNFFTSTPLPSFELEDPDSFPTPPPSIPEPEDPEELDFFTTPPSSPEQNSEESDSFMTPPSSPEPKNPEESNFFTSTPLPSFETEDSDSDWRPPPPSSEQFDPDSVLTPPPSRPQQEDSEESDDEPPSGWFRFLGDAFRNTKKFLLSNSISSSHSSRRGEGCIATPPLSRPGPESGRQTGIPEESDPFTTPPSSHEYENSEESLPPGGWSRFLDEAFRNRTIVILPNTTSSHHNLSCRDGHSIATPSPPMSQSGTPSRTVSPTLESSASEASDRGCFREALIQCFPGIGPLIENWINCYGSSVQAMAGACMKCNCEAACGHLCVFAIPGCRLACNLCRLYYLFRMAE